jgi:hypothetical protein
MKTQLVAVILLTLVSTTLSAADPRDPLLGRWQGTSICTKARSACRDEVVVYHVTRGPQADMVIVDAKKIVDGKELDMGTLDFHVDFAKHTMTAHFDNGRVASRWTFTWTPTEMKGTAVLLPSEEVGRNVSLRR